MRTLPLILLMMAQSAVAEQSIDSMLKLWDFQDPRATEQMFTALLDEPSSDAGFKPAVISQIART